ncbi:DPH3 homolog [Labrus bergylta]|uniref:DPH3 homolog n=1 Tax=Labrus bergylta TaxID=56723 RepID=UPI003313DC71
MSVFHDEVEIEDFEFDEETETFYFPCPCGDKFAISKEDLENGEEVASCPSCSLLVKVIYELLVKELFMSGEIIDAPSSSSEAKLELVQSS